MFLLRFGQFFMHDDRATMHEDASFVSLQRTFVSPKRAAMHEGQSFVSLVRRSLHEEQFLLRYEQPAV
jgi:hypothetical protein